MVRLMDFMVGGLCCCMAILFYFNVNSKLSPIKQEFTAYSSEQECNKDTGKDCENTITSFYVIKK